MKSKIFTSESGWFSLTLPEKWEEYDDEEGTYAFFDTESWTGNFRITPLRWTRPENSNEDQAYKFIVKKTRENEAATKIQLGDFACSFYKEDLTNDKENSVIYYWIIGKMNTLFICSFTIDKEQESTKENENALEIVRNIIKSIVIHYFSRRV
jgi:hypothetical protein